MQYISVNVTGPQHTRRDTAEKNAYDIHNDIESELSVVHLSEANSTANREKNADSIRKSQVEWSAFRQNDHFLRRKGKTGNDTRCYLVNAPVIMHEQVDVTKSGQGLVWKLMTDGHN